MSDRTGKNTAANVGTTCDEVAQYTRSLIAKHNLTQEEFAARVGLSVERVKNFVRGRVKRIRQAELVAIGKAFNHADGWNAQQIDDALTGIEQNSVPRVVVRAVISRCEHGQPIADIQVAPWIVDTKIRPHQLERLARHLLVIASAAKKLEGKDPITVVLS